MGEGGGKPKYGAYMLSHCDEPTITPWVVVYHLLIYNLKKLVLAGACLIANCDEPTITPGGIGCNF